MPKCSVKIFSIHFERKLTKNTFWCKSGVLCERRCIGARSPIEDKQSGYYSNDNKYEMYL